MIGVASLIFFLQWRKLRRKGVDLDRLYGTLPPE